MASIHEQLSEQFYKWESRGRGWQVFNDPYIPNTVCSLHWSLPPETPTVTTGIDPLPRFIISKASPPPLPVVPEEDPEPQILIRDSLVELQTSYRPSSTLPGHYSSSFF